MTQKARRLIEEARNAIVSTEEQLLLHSYPGALEKKGISKAKLTLVAVQQRHTTKTSIRMLEIALGRASCPLARDFLSKMLEKVRIALNALEPFGKSIGLSVDDLDAGEPLSGAIGYSMYLYWLASNGTAAELAGAFLVNMPSWSLNCARVSRALQANYGLMKADVAFFDLFTDIPPEFEEAGLEVVEKGLEQGADPVLIRRAVRLIQRYELMFWDTMWERSRC